MVPRTRSTRTCSSWVPAAARTWRSRWPQAGTIKHIDAVEIDPAIQQIGASSTTRTSPTTTRGSRPIINDGRAFLRSTDQKYDLIIFALPDSLTLVSQAANVRLESFLFTEEAFKSVADHLTDDGIFVLYNYYREPWLVTKLATMLERRVRHAAAAADVRARSWRPSPTGPLVAKLDGRPPPGDTLRPHPGRGRADPPASHGRLAVPVPAHRLRGRLLPAGPGHRAARRLRRGGRSRPRVTGTSFRRFSPHFFVLGIAFLLLETRSLVSFSLLFGTTWLVNALAFFGVLAQRPGGHLHQLAVPHPAARTCCTRCCSRALAVAWLLPPESLLIDPPWLRYALAVAARVRAGVLRQPRVQPLVPGHPDGGHGVRQQPAGRHGRRRAGVPGAHHRLPGAAAARRRPLRPRVAVRDPLPAAGGP